MASISSKYVAQLPKTHKFWYSISFNIISVLFFYAVYFCLDLVNHSKSGNKIPLGEFGFFIGVICFIGFIPKAFAALKETKSHPLVWLRAVLSTLGMYLSFVTISLIGNTNYTVINNLAPLLILFGWWWLSPTLVKHQKRDPEKFSEIFKDRYNLLTILAVAIMLLLTFHKEGSDFSHFLQWGFAFAILALLVIVATDLITKKLREENVSSSSMIFIYSITTLGMGGISLIMPASFMVPDSAAVPVFGFVMPESSQWIPLLGAGIFAYCALYLSLRSFKDADPPLLRILGYFNIVPATLIDYWVRDKVPDATSLFLISVVILLLIGLTLLEFKRVKENP